MESFKIYVYSCIYALNAILYLWILAKVITNQNYKSKHKVLKSNTLRIFVILIIAGSFFNALSISHVPRLRELVYPAGSLLFIFWLIYIHVKFILKK